MKISGQSISARRQDERGVVLILVALSMVVLIGACALAVDVGRVVVVNRSMQTVADAGALDAARFLDISTVNNARLTTEAQHAATDNGYSCTSCVTAVQGTLVGSTFTPGTGQFVKVTVAQSLAHLFQPGGSSLSRFAIAEANPPNAGFSIGTYLLSFNSQNSAVLNPLLSALGTTINFTAVGYQGMANTNVTVQQLIDASGGVLTPTNVLNTSLSAAQWDSFLTTAVASQAARSHLLGCHAATRVRRQYGARGAGASSAAATINAHAVPDGLDQRLDLLDDTGSVGSLGQPERVADSDHRG